MSRIITPSPRNFPKKDRGKETSMERKPPNPTRPKVVAATSGAGVGVALGEILLYAVDRLDPVPLPAHVEVAVVFVAASAFAYLAGWLKRD